MAAERRRCERCPAGAECPFCGLEGEARDAFEAIAEIRCYAAGTRLVEQGERPEGLFIVRQGLVRLRHDADDGRCLIFGLVGRAGLVGLAEVVNGKRSRLSAVTLQATTVELVPRREMVRFLVRYPASVVPLLVWESEELERFTDELVAERRPRPMPVRLLERLRDLAEVCGQPVDGGVLIDLPLSVRNVGDTLGCSRQWASKLLGEAEAAGLVERRHRRIVLTRTALQAGSGSHG